MVNAPWNRHREPAVEAPKVLVGYAAVVVTHGLDLVLGRPSCTSKAVAPTMWCELYEDDRSFSRAISTVQAVWGDRVGLTAGVSEVVVIDGRPLPVDYWYLDEPGFRLDNAPSLPDVAELGLYNPRDLRNALDSEPELFAVTGAPPITRAVIDAHSQRRDYRLPSHRNFR